VLSKKKTKKIFLIILLAIILIGGYLIFANRVAIRGWFDLWYRKSTLPPAQEFSPIKIEAVKNSAASSVNQKEETQKQSPIPANLQTDIIITPPPSTASSSVQDSLQENVLPMEINLAVPFVSQAPFKNWDALHEETCEEASAVMINGFYTSVKVYTRGQMEDELQKIVDWENINFGFFEDTTAEETVQFIKAIYGLNAVVKYDITLDDIKQTLASDQPVIVPAAGKLLPNPYFSNGGPLYHMLVVKGYTKDGKFITNDPGTNTLGENFTYKFDDLYNAIHDWVKSGDVLTGRKAMIVVE